MSSPSRKTADRFDLKFVYPFMQAAIDVLRLQYSFIARPGKPSLKSKSAELPVDIVTFGGLKGPTVTGSVVLCFTEKVFLQVMECMHDEKYSDASEETIRELVQGSSEILGIIVWQARKLLSEKGIEVEPTVPMTARGSELVLSYRSTSPTVLLPFSTNVGPFQIEVTVERSEEEEESEGVEAAYG